MFIVGQNVNGLCIKTLECKFNSLNIDADFYLITVTNLVEGMGSEEVLDLNNYNVFRQVPTVPEAKNWGGGVLIAKDIWMILNSDVFNSRIHVFCIY